MKTMLTLGAALLAAGLSLPAFADGNNDLTTKLDAACASLPDAPATTRSLADQAKALDSFAAAVAVQQECLYREINHRRDRLTQSEQAVIAGKLSRSAYALTAARIDYASALRASRMPVQVAQVVMP